MNPEKATDYLSKVNWKSLIEWLTAEAILNRPANPVQFCRDLLGETLADQKDPEFKPDEITDWLRNCYTEATALVDEHGVIQGKTLETAQQTLNEQVIDLFEHTLHFWALVLTSWVWNLQLFEEIGQFSKCI